MWMEEGPWTLHSYSQTRNKSLPLQLSMKDKKTLFATVKQTLKRVTEELPGLLNIVITTPIKVEPRELMQGIIP